MSLEVVSGGGPNDYYTDNWNPSLKSAEIFDEGDVIIASSAGGAYGSFEVQGQGCANLETDLSCPPAFVDGEPLEIHWAVGEKQGDTILFSMASGNHASNFSSILCKTDDTGLLHVDAALITAYLSDFHPIETWELSRFRDGVTTVKGKRIILRTQSIQSCRW